MINYKKVFFFFFFKKKKITIQYKIISYNETKYHIILYLYSKKKKLKETSYI